MAFAKNRLDDGLTFLAARFEFFGAANKKGDFAQEGAASLVQLQERKAENEECL